MIGTASDCERVSVNEFGEYTFFGFPKVLTDCSGSNTNDLADVFKRRLARFTIISQINCCLKHFFLS